MKRLSQLLASLCSARAILAAAMTLFIVAAGPVSQTLAVECVDGSGTEHPSGRVEFKLVVAGAWDESARDQKSHPTENKSSKHESLLRPLSDHWDTAKVVQFSADAPTAVAPLVLGHVTLVKAVDAPQAILAPPHVPIRPGHAPPQLS